MRFVCGPWVDRQAQGPEVRFVSWGPWVDRQAQGPEVRFVCGLWVDRHAQGQDLRLGGGFEPLLVLEALRIASLSIGAGSDIS